MRKQIDGTRVARRIFGLLIVVGIVGLAYFFSSQNGPQSHGISRTIVRAFLQLLGIPDSYQNMKAWNFVIRKIAHFTIYFLLGCGLALIICGNGKPRKEIAICAAIGCVFAAMDEFHQSFTGRTDSVWDVMLDTCGVAAGSAAVMWALRKWANRN